MLKSILVKGSIVSLHSHMDSWRPSSKTSAYLLSHNKTSVFFEYISNDPNLLLLGMGESP